jgi:hypothetical protein
MEHSPRRRSSRRARTVRTVWIIERGNNFPRLVTAYPHGDRRIAMTKELERIVLTVPLPSEHLESGDVGTVVHLHAVMLLN